MESELGPAQQGFISVVVLVKLCWLQSVYRVTPSELLDLIDDLLCSRYLQMEHRRRCEQRCTPCAITPKPAQAWPTR